MKRATIAVLTIALAGCAGGSKVGDEGLLKDLEGKSGRLGNIERSQSPQPKQNKPRRTTVKPSETAAPKPTVKTWELSITAEGFEAVGFDAYNFAVFQGDLIKVTNKDAQVRSFREVGDDPSFDSGDLKKGQSWTYKAGKVGTFNFEDSTRPFRVGRLIVQKKP